MKRKPKMITVINVLLLGVLTQFNNCGYYKAVRTEKTSTMGNPMREKTSFAVGKYQQIESLSLCIQKITLTDAANNNVVVPYESQGEILIPMGGIDLGTLPVPSGQYTKIALEVADVCGKSRSVAVTNSSGTFITNLPLSIKFSGSEFVGNTLQKIILDPAALAQNLSQAMSSANVASLASDSLGLYHSLSCGMQTSAGPVALCERFDKASAVAGRSGQLDNSLWTVSRTSNITNQGQQQFNVWSQSSIDACGTLQTATPGISDLLICNGQLRQSSNDAGNVTALTMTPNQAFDFKDRTGTVAFDLTNDTSGTTGVYPEIYLSERPIQAAQNFNGIKGIPKNGISIRFAADLKPQTGANYPGCVNDSNARWSIDRVTFYSNYSVRTITVSDNDPQFVPFGCVISSSGPNGAMNHIELRVSQAQVEVWATDAGSAGLKKIGLIKNAALPFSRGFLSFGDYHNKAAAGPRPETENHTFAWDNIAFDGPVLARELSFDVADAMTPAGAGQFNLGFNTFPGSPAQLSSLPLTSQDVASATSSGKNALLALNFTSSFTSVSSFNYTVNGIPLTAVVPFTVGVNNIYSVELPIPASALVAGPQVIKIEADQTVAVYNVNVRLPMN